MIPKSLWVGIAIGCISLPGYGDGTIFVRQDNGTNAVAPYTNWTSAATHIVDALEHAVDGSTILVDDGHYQLDSELLVTNQVVIQGVNGPETTIIDGQGSVRCFNLEHPDSVVSGLSITGGYANASGGGISCLSISPVITNCVISGNIAADDGGGVYGGTLNHCTISDNTADRGGGMSGSVANYCTISDNQASRYGGGVYNGTVNYCMINRNSANYDGGGMSDGTAYSCVISENNAPYGGGGYSCVVSNCIIDSNTAESRGGGIDQSTAYNSLIRDNAVLYHHSVTGTGGNLGEPSPNKGGGAAFSELVNCTVVGNSSAEACGGMYYCDAVNCIVWYNEALTYSNIGYGSVSYTCSPDLVDGVNGNSTHDPLLIGSSNLATNSPCRGAGSFADVAGVDLDGLAWLNPPSMGCREVYIPATGPLQVDLACSTDSTVAGYMVRFLDDVYGLPNLLVWDFGDGTAVTNQPFPEHSWSVPGDYEVVLTAFNDSWPDGVTATQTVHVADVENTAVYVAVDGNDTNDGSCWADAKASIQAGVDAQQYTGGLVLVSNGTYFVDAEINIRKIITVQGVDGPSGVFVNGQGSVRCFNLGNTKSVLSGLTITNGDAYDGGGIYCEGVNPIVTNCVIRGNSASSEGGGMLLGTANNCIISGNSARFGGGMSEGTANHCTISGNSAEYYGGGMYYGTANNCTIIDNVCIVDGDGAGGGMAKGTANNCTIIGNTANGSGGGMLRGTANNCTIIGNTAAGSGGGMVGGTANNCTIINNSALIEGGGMYACDAVNSIVWYNHAPSSGNIGALSFGTISYTCSPDLDHGVDGNITNAPLLIGSAHIATNSPCRGAGSYADAAGVDMDGQAWLNPPSMGCDEVYLPAEGPLQVGIICSTEYVLTGDSVRFWDDIIGTPSLMMWDFGDGAAVTNQPYPEHSWSVPGDYEVVLTSFNDSWQGGISATQTVHVADFENTGVYVATDGNDAQDGSSWASAKATIQAGVDAQNYPGGLVLVGQGTYALDTEINIRKTVTVQGVHGPSGIIVDGQGSVRCFDLGSTKCVLSGLTITNGYSSGYGGGLHCEGLNPIATNCVIIGNSARSGGGMSGGTANNCIISGNSASFLGGGMSGGTANNCTITGNLAASFGGGMYAGTANNCTISGNSASAGGGVAYGWANNCIIWYNEAPTASNLNDTTARYTCSPDLTAGVDGNITAPPQFVNRAAGDYRLQPTSPCINAGNIIYVTSAMDLDGNPRIINGVVDMGAYEYIDPAADYDGDGLGNDEEMSIHGTDPFDPDTDGDGEFDGLEVRMGFNPLSPSSSLSFMGWPSESGYKLGFSTVTNRLFTVESRDSLLTGAWIERLGLEGTGEAFILIDPTITSNRFYRIRVDEP